MDFQSVHVLCEKNFHEWRDKVKYEPIAYGPGLWKLVCDGYYKYSPSMQEKQWNVKKKCVMFKNLQNKDLDTVISLTSAKEILDTWHLIHEGETSSSSILKEKRKRKKKNPRRK